MNHNTRRFYIIYDRKDELTEFKTLIDRSEWYYDYESAKANVSKSTHAIITFEMFIDRFNETPVSGAQ